MSKVLMPSVAGYTLAHLRSDMVAALVVAAVAVPASLGLATIVGLPPVAGLYTGALAPIVFAIFARTKRLIVGADSATAVLVASGAALVASVGTAEYGGAVAVLGLIVAVMLIVMAVLRFGFIADVISRPVLVGFFAGIGIQLAVTQLPEMVGLSSVGTIGERSLNVLTHIGSWNGMTVTLTILVVGIVALTRRTKIPGPLLGLAAASCVAVLFGLERFGVTFVGVLPSGLPGIPQLPSLEQLPDMIIAMAPVALSIALIIVAQSSAIIRSAASSHDEGVQLNRDIFSLGIANAVSALVQGFAVNGSPPRTEAADMAGGKTQMVNVFVGLIVITLLVVGAALFEYIPHAALAAIVFAIGLQLVRVQEFKYLFDTHKIEFAIALITLLAIVVFGVRQGIFIAIVIALIERLLRQYHPHDEVLLRDGVLSDWAKDRIDPHHRHSSSPAGLLVYRFDSPLYFENVEYFALRLKRAVKKAQKPVSYVVVDAGAIDGIDYTAVEKIKQIYRNLSHDGIKLGFSHVSPFLEKQFKQFGVTNIIGKRNIFPTLSEAIKRQPGNARSAREMVARLELESDSYVLIGGGVLEAYGIRKTYDIDLVVSDAIYRHFRDEKKWKEYVQDSGKRMLTRNGYNLMRSWMGYTLPKLRKEASVHDGVPCMSLRQLIAAKQRLGRPKDLDDIERIEQYIARSR